MRKMIFIIILIMKRTIKAVALLAVLSVAAVGCQKETVVVSQTGAEESGTVYTVRYSVNGVSHTETLIGEQAWADFLQRMLALAEEGHRVTMSRSANTAQYSETEVLTIEQSQYPARGKKELSCLNEGLEDMFWETKTVYPKPVGVTDICIHY